MRPHTLAARHALALVTVLATAALAAGPLAAPAAAQQWPPPARAGTRHVIGGELSFYQTQRDFGFGADGTATILSPLLLGRFGVTEAIDIGVLWGFGYASVSVDSPLGDDSGSAFEPGNPWVECTYALGVDAIRLRFGGGLALPLADIDETADAIDVQAEAIGLFGASATRGFWNPWLWDPNRFTLAGVFRADGDPPQTFYWAAESAFGILVDVGDPDTDGDRETEVVFQLAGEAGGRLGAGGAFILGGRLQAVIGMTTDGDDDAQISVEPFFRWEAERGYVVARLTVNLDDPLGFAFDDDKVWGLHVGGGGRF